MTRPNPLDRSLHKPAHAPGPPVADEETQDDAVIGRAFRWSLLAFVVIAVPVAGGVWWSNRPAPVETTAKATVTLPEPRATETIDLPALPFSEVTKQAGIDYVHESGAIGGKLLPETMGGGVGVLDYDSDGDADILFVNSRQWLWNLDKDEEPATCALYENDGTGRFTDVSKETGLDISLYGQGCGIGDFDNDGDPDIYLTAVGYNRLLRNDDGKFVDITKGAGVAGGENDWGTSCGWFDYDNDGLLDLFVCNYVEWTREYDAAQNFRLVGSNERAYGRPQNFAGTFPVLYRNMGDGRFKDVTAEAGLQVRNPAQDTPMGKSLGLTFADFDRDDDLDIVVANDTVQNFLFENLGNGTFQEIGASTGIAFGLAGEARGAMGIDSAIFRNGEALAVAIGNFANEMTAFYVTDPGQMSFTDEAVSNGLGPQTRLQLTFGVLLADFDLDGRPDLFAANGHLEDDIHRVQQSQYYEQAPQLFWNCGPDHATEFCPLTPEQMGEEFFEPTVGRGAASADFDGDGDLDIIMTAIDRPARLFRNDLAKNHRWLRLKLVGDISNRDAIGATAVVRESDGLQAQTVMPTCGYLSQSEKTLTFGFGPGEADDPIDSVEIRWPSGRTTQLRDVEANRVHRITEE